jgi:hypothetical protein
MTTEASVPGDQAFNHLFDKLVRPELCLFGRPWCAFHLCGGLGSALTLALTMALVAHLGLSPWVMAAILLTSALTFLGLVMAVKIATGDEQMTYYHHELAVMAAVALLLWLFEQPLLPYLDVTILGVGMFLACGRIGCLMVGCCYGLPSSWGVCYGEEHVIAGFSRHYVQVRLFPIQIVESLWTLAIVLVGSGMVCSEAAAGAALAWYVVAYSLGRFMFEYRRGDSGRPDFRGLSEAQWLACAHIAVIVGAELCGVLALHLWHVGAFGGLTLAMIGLSRRRHGRTSATYQGFNPHPLTGEV